MIFKTSCSIASATLAVHTLWFLGTKVFLSVVISRITHVTQGNNIFRFMFPLSTPVTILLQFTVKLKNEDNHKNEDNLKHEDNAKMKTTSKMKTTKERKTTKEMKIPSKMKTTSKMKMTSTMNTT